MSKTQSPQRRLIAGILALLAPGGGVRDAPLPGSPTARSAPATGPSRRPGPPSTTATPPSSASTGCPPTGSGVSSRPTAQTTLSGDDDTSVCTVAFKGTFAPGQVDLAPPDEQGRYALVLVTSRHLQVLASAVLDQLPQSLGKRTI